MDSREVCVGRRRGGACGIEENYLVSESLPHFFGAWRSTGDSCSTARALLRPLLSKGMESPSRNPEVTRNPSGSTWRERDRWERRSQSERCVWGNRDPGRPGCCPRRQRRRKHREVPAAPLHVRGPPGPHLSASLARPPAGPGCSPPGATENATHPEAQRRGEGGPVRLPLVRLPRSLQLAGLTPGGTVFLSEICNVVIYKSVKFVTL